MDSGFAGLLLTESSGILKAGPQLQQGRDTWAAGLLGAQSSLSVDRLPLHPSMKGAQCEPDLGDGFLVKGKREAAAVSGNFW